jgi:pheromone shutdown protein TraB
MTLLMIQLCVLLACGSVVAFLTACMTSNRIITEAGMPAAFVCLLPVSRTVTSFVLLMACQDLQDGDVPVLNQHLQTRLLAVLCCAVVQQLQGAGCGL